MAGIIFGCIMLVLVGWAILKGKYASFILFASGAAMLLFSIIFDTGSFMPKKALPTGNDYLNIIEFIRYMFSNNLSNLGLLIMTMVGFASYMTHIGANDAFVNIAIKPLSLIKSPYALVFIAFLLGKAVSMVITSAVGLGVLCLALMGPALAALGMNKKTIAAVFVTSGAASMEWKMCSHAPPALSRGLGPFMPNRKPRRTARNLPQKPPFFLSSSS